jgi:hypothetical protein
MSDGERKYGRCRCDKYTAISAARASEDSRGMESEGVKVEERWLFLFASTVSPT